MRRQFNNIISVAHSAVRFGILKLLNGKNFSVDMVERFSPDVVFEVTKGAKVRLGKRIRAHSGCKFKIRRNAELVIGDGVKINYYCIFACHEKITVGAGTEFGPSVYVYDHDHDYKAGLKNNRFVSSAVSIGKNCWIGANTVILRGTTIGDNSVVGAGCILQGNYSAGSMIVQKRETSVQSFQMG